MFNHIYGSPFPTINPKVRYKTVFERAGFDTNFRGAPIQQELGSDRRNASTSSLQYPPFNKNQETRVHSLPGIKTGKGRVSLSPSLTAAPPVPKSYVHKRPTPYEVDGTKQQPNNITSYEMNSLASNLGSEPILNPYTTDGPAQQPYGTHSGTTNPYSKEDPVQHPYGIEPPARNPYRTNITPTGDESAEEVASLRGNSNKSGSNYGFPSPEPSISESQTPPQSRSSSKSAGSSANGDKNELKSGTFDFEVPQASQESLNPIEKSFMMLTQNHSSSSERSMTSDSGTKSMHTAHISLEENSDLSGISNLHIPSVTDEDFSDSEDDNGDDQSLNFEPCAELNVSLSSDKRDDRVNGVDRSEAKLEPAPLPILEVTTHFDTEPILESSSFKHHLDTTDNSERDANISHFHNEVRPSLAYCDFGEKLGAIQGEIKDGSEQRKLDQSSSPSLNVRTLNVDSQTATNSQLENLLAQFNDVSQHKNAQLDSYVNSSTNTISDSATSPVGARSLSVEKSLSPMDSVTHFKKSSAYLSGYPMDNIPQSSNTNEPVVTKSGEAPLFYNFKQHHLNDFTKSDENVLRTETGHAGLKEQLHKDCIAAVQLKHKNNDEILQESSQQKDFEISKIQELKESREEGLEEKRHISSEAPQIDGDSECRALLQNKSKHEPNNEGKCEHANGPCQEEGYERKYPPGEGPCRLCGLKVTEKGMFSKKDNELSGQWHRSCFRCLKCDVKFSKQTPCYILDDKPYCQRHYHEENNSICQICDGFIEGECLENDRSERFHVNCLTCFLCRTAISSDYFIYNEELPLCAHHDMESLVGNDSKELSGKGNLSKRRTRLINFSQS